MNAHSQITAAATWHDLLATARTCGGQRALWVIGLLQIEAEELASSRFADWRIHAAIAVAAQGYIDCPCEDCLDEIEALLADDERPELEFDGDDNFWRDSIHAARRGMDEASAWGLAS